MIEITSKHLFCAAPRCNQCFCKQPQWKKDSFFLFFTYKNVQRFISDHLHHVLRALSGQSDAFHAPTSAPGKEEGWGGHGVFTGSEKEGQ